MRFQKRAVLMLGGFLAAAVAAAPVGATVVPDRSSAIGQKEYRHPNLRIPNELERADLRAGGTALVQAAERLGVTPQHAYLDRRGGRWGTLLLAHPLIPGTGDGNSLAWDDLGMAVPASDAELGTAAWRAFVSYLRGRTAEFAIDPSELAEPGRLAVHDGGQIIQIHAPRIFRGVPVRDSYLTAVVNHGNLVLLGADNWGSISVGTTPRVPEAQATQTLMNHVAPSAPSGYRARAELAIVPLSSGPMESVALGGGYDYRLAWVLSPRFEGEIGTWEAVVDANSGELISFLDLNQYQSARKVVGGVYPVSNDGVPPDGVEVPGTPMPFTDVVSGPNTFITDTGGNVGVCLAGTVSTSLAGRYIRMSDTCGVANETSGGDIDLSQSGGTDCTVPAGHSAGDTHASRTGFYELNKLNEQARGQLPNNTWLQQQLTSNMNLNQTCNAFWDGASVNFFRSGGGCNNTGEIAGIFDHEWGHGMDDNDLNPTVGSPGEAVADIYMTLRLKNSCIGRNFFQAGQCSGYGDPCVTGCDGVRDINFANHASGQPHTLTWIQTQCPAGGGICGGEVHCEGYPMAEVLWDYFNRDLPTVFGMSSDTALEIATRTMYLGGGPVGNWYQCVQGSGGCPASSGYMNFLAVDDDNGNLTDGTPHMQALFGAFNRHGVACPTPVVQNSGCPGAPTTAPVVSGTPTDRGVNLSWAPVPGAVKYKVLRTEGVFACNFGKAIIGETLGTTFSDSGLQNGRAYSYGVMAVGLAGTCLSPMSSCTTVTPVAGANLNVDPSTGSMSITSGDADPYLDNCENATVSLSIANIGSSAQTNVRIAAVQPITHPAMPILGTSPPTPSVASCASAPASFTFRAVDLVPDDFVRFRVDVTSDQLSPAVRSQVLQFAGTEGNNQFVATQTFDFETGTEGWQTVTGTFNRTNAAPGGAGGAGTFYYQSSSFLDNQCDEVQSPVLSLTATSTLSLQNNYDIEIFSAGSWYDRANVGRLNVASGVRTVVAPSGGRPYNASGPGGVCGLNNQQGWAAANPTWGGSTWTAAALGSPTVVGQPIRLNIKYGTDPAANGFGFRFDQVTLTDFNLKIADTQTNTCTGGNGAPVAVPDSDSAGTLGVVTVPVLANDSDPNGDCLRVTQLTTPPNGNAFINFVGCGLDTVSYYPNLSCGNPCNDSFQYTVSDGQGGTATATVTISQTPVQLQGLSVE